MVTGKWSGAFFLILLAIVISSVHSILDDLARSEFSGFVRLLEDSDLFYELEAEEKFRDGVTILAPSDQALKNNVAPEILRFLALPSNKAFLRKVMLHHLLPGKLVGPTWVSGSSVTSLDGTSLDFFLEGGERHVEGAIVKELSILETEISIVHSIDILLVPEDVLDAIDEFSSTSFSFYGTLFQEEGESRRFLQGTTTIAPSPSNTDGSVLTTLLAALTENGNFSTLLELINSLSLADNLTIILTSGENLTLVAPDDRAFQNLAFTQLSNSVLTNVLLYHIVVGAYSYDDLRAVGNGTSSISSSGTLNTLANATVTVTTVNRVVYFNNVTILSSDILPASSGLAVHGIESVLIPPYLLESFAPPGPSPPPGVSVVASPPPPPATSPPPSAGQSSRIISSFVWLMTLLGGVAVFLQ